MQAALPFFIADGAEAQGQQFLAIKKTLFLFISNRYYRFIMSRCEILLSYRRYMQNTFYTFSKYLYNNTAILKLHEGN